MLVAGGNQGKLSQPLNPLLENLPRDAFTGWLTKRATRFPVT